MTLAWCMCVEGGIRCRKDLAGHSDLLELFDYHRVAFGVFVVSSPALSALLTFFVFIIGHFSADLKVLANASGSAPARWLFRGLYYLLPNLSNYSVITPTAHGLTPEPAAVLVSGIYAVVYVAVLLSVASLIFGRRNFK